MDDMQFIGSPALADVDGDGVAETISGSGAYLVRAYRADGIAARGLAEVHARLAPLVRDTG